VGLNSTRVGAGQVEPNGAGGSVCVTPHVSKPHDYVNHMFMRP
jgi:hypothetical protein